MTKVTEEANSMFRVKGKQSFLGEAGGEDQAGYNLILLTEEGKLRVRT